jgi:ABC-2 type transport system ATP-binding protein
MIELHAVAHRYGSHQALLALSLRLEGPQLIALIGANGAGKSTLIRALVGEIDPSEGRIFICDEEMYPESPARRLIGYLPEESRPYSESSVYEYLHLMASLRGLGGSSRREAIEWASARCDLNDLLSTPIKALSKGMKQRVGLAQAILHKPPVLILDELSSGLDPHQAHALLRLLKDLSTESLVLISTHRLDTIENYADQVCLLEKGGLKAYGPLVDLRAQESDEARCLTLLIEGLNPSATEEEARVELMSTLNTLELGSILEVARTASTVGSPDVWSVKIECPVSATPSLLKKITHSSLKLYGAQRAPQRLSRLFSQLSSADDLRS